MTDAAIVNNAPIRYEERDIDTLTAAARNANHMDEATYSALLEEMRQVGFVDPPLVAPDGEIIDGHHRIRAASELGYSRLPCVVALDGSVADRMRQAVALATNHLRGRRNLSVVVEILRDLSGEYAPELLAPVAGFTLVDMQELLTPPPGPNTMSGGEGGEDGGDDREAPERPFALDGITFRSGTTLKAVKRALRKAAGKGRDLSVGLLNILSIEDK